MSLSITRLRLGWLLIGMALLVGVWLRARNLTEHPFWLDEAYSAFAADRGYAFILTVLPGYETHPPFFSALLRSWTLIAGDSLGAYRAFGAVGGILILPFVWMAARELERGLDRTTWSIAIPALLLAASLPSLVDTARLVRPYYALSLANAFGLWSVLRLARIYRETATLDRASWWAYLASLVFLFWLHNLGALYVAALGIGLLMLIGSKEMFRDHGRRFLVGHLIVAVFTLPAFMILIDQAPSWAQSTWLKFDGTALFDNILLTFGLPGPFGFAAALVLGGTAIGKAKGSRIPTTLLVFAATPPLLALALTFAIAPVFLPRTLVAAGIPLIILIATGANLGMVQRATFVMLLGLALMRVILVQQLPPEQNWYQAVRWLSPRLDRGDLVYAYPNEGALPFRYALRDLHRTAAIRQIPSEIPARDPTGWYPTGSRGVQSLPSARLKQIANDPVSQATSTIWLLRLGPSAYDKKDDFLNILRGSRAEVARFTDREIDIVGLRIRSPQPAPAQQAKP